MAIPLTAIDLRAFKGKQDRSLADRVQVEFSDYQTIEGTIKQAKISHRLQPVQIYDQTSHWQLVLPYFCRNASSRTEGIDFITV